MAAEPTQATPLLELLSDAEGQKCASHLQSIWMDMGYSSQDVELKLRQLRDALLAHLDHAVSVETAKAAQLHEELVTMSSEITSLSEVLSVDAFFPDDSSSLLLQRHRTLQEVLSRLHALAADRGAQRAEKEAALKATLLELEDMEESDDVHTVMEGEREPGPEQSGGLSAALLERVGGRLSKAMSLQAERMEYAKGLLEKVARLQRDLGIEGPGASELEPTVKAASRSAIRKSEQELEQLSAERERRLRVLNECAEYIGELQRKLKLPDEELAKLPLPEAGLSQQVLAAYHAELERLDKLKMKSLARLLQDAKERVQQLWQELHFSEAECLTSAAAYEGAARVAARSEGPTPDDSGEQESAALDDLLEATEAEELRLQQRLESTSKVLALMERREQILLQKEEMLKCENDPARLLGKGKGAGSRLLQEQKLRVAVEKDLPRMNKKLRELVSAWQEEHGGEEMQYDGVAILKMLREQEEEDARRREEERQRKDAERLEKAEAKKSNTPRAAAVTNRPRTAPVAAKDSAAAGRPAKAVVEKPAIKPTATTAKPPPPQHAIPSDRVLKELGMVCSTPIPRSPTTYSGKTVAVLSTPPPLVGKENPEMESHAAP